MTPRQEIRKISVDLTTPELLAYLVKERFPGEIVVTASLMASSVVVLKMISDIDPATATTIVLKKDGFREERRNVDWTEKTTQDVPFLLKP